MSDITLTNDDSVVWIPTKALHAMAAAAWMSILLGLLVECLVLATRAVAGTAPQLAQTVAELAGSVTWAVVVCTGISLGSAASRHRQRMMGLIGLTVNEVIFPIGCVAVLYFIARLNDRAEAGAART